MTSYFSALLAHRRGVNIGLGLSCANAYALPVNTRDSPYMYRGSQAAHIAGYFL